MIDKQQIKEYIFTIKDRREIKELWALLKQRAKQIEEKITIKFNVGDKVEFYARGSTIIGTITQINRATIKVKTDTTIWRVTPSLLTKIEG